MATTIEDIVLRFKTIGTEGIKSAKNAVNDLKNDVADFAQVGGPLQNTLNGIVGKLGPVGLAAGAAGSAFAIMGGHALRLAGDLEDIAGATGIATGKINSFAGSLIDAGGKAEDAGSILAKLNQSINDAASGNETLQKAFQNLGVFVTDSSGQLRSAGDILDDITTKFQNGDLTAKEYAAAIDIMGKNLSRLDLEKLNAADNPAITEATKNIDKFNEMLDTLYKTIKDNILIVFGEFAKTINEGGISGGLALITEQLGLLAAGILNLPTDSLASLLNLFGAEIKNPVGLGDGVKKLVEQAKQARLAAQAEAVAAKEAQAKLEKANKVTSGSTSGGTPAAGGGFGATPEATLKAIADSRKRIAQSDSETRKQIELSTANDIQKIEIAARYEAAKAKTEIDSQERLSAVQKSAEYAAKEKEIFAKRDGDITKARQQLNVRIAAEEMAQAEQNARDMAGYYQQVDQARIQAFDQVESIKLAREEMQRRVDVENTLITLSDRETKNALELLNLEEERLKAVRAIAAIPYADRVEREKAVNAEYEKSRNLILSRQTTEFEATRSFSQGWSKALADYTENSQNSFQQAGKLFQRVTGGMEDSIVNFAKTGKFEFKGFLASILEDILRSQVSKLISGLFGVGGGGKGGLFGGAIIPGFLAAGGPALAGKPYIVGEKGPELFVPNNSGTVVSNGQFGTGGGTSVIYNINAVDASSFKQLVARDPGFIYAVTEQGRRILPQTRR